MQRQVLDDVASTVAQQNAMERGCTFLPHGCRLFPVESGWESAMIAKDGGVRTCDTLLSLESALRDGEVKVIFIPQGALMNLSDIEKICARNAAVKTLFQEVKKP